VKEMNFDLSTLESAHKHCIFNKNEILKSSLCGCFYCFSIYKPSEIEEWTDQDNPKGETALCPKCNIDSVIGDKSGFSINDEFLKAMYSKYF
jgi:hypothetical protein